MKKECMFIVTDTIEISIGSVIHQTSCNAEQEHNAISLFVQKKETLLWRNTQTFFRKKCYLKRTSIAMDMSLTGKLHNPQLDIQFSMSVLVCLSH